MADIVTKIITPADSYDLISLADAKILLGIDTADTTADQQLQMLITQNSHVIAKMAGRVFGREQVRETWRCVGPVCCPDGAARIYLLHYPVKEDDITLVETPRGTVIDPADYDLDEESGKLTIFGGYSNEIVVTYWGGYDLPENAPPDLQQAAGLLVRQFRTEAAQAGTVGSGIRMLAHKDSRVMYFSPKDMAGGSTTSTTGGGASSSTNAAINNLLIHYKHIWC